MCVNDVSMFNESLVATVFANVKKDKQVVSSSMYPYVFLNHSR